MRHSLLAAALLASFSGCLDDDLNSDQQAATGELGLHGAPEHVFNMKANHGNVGPAAPLTFHGGTVLASNKTEAIFWGTSWATYTGDKVTGLDSFFRGFGGSRYAAASTEYSGSNGQVTSTSVYLGHTFDNSAAPTKALTTLTAVAEGCKITGSNPDPNALYLIYTDTPAGHVSYCAWHSWGNCSNGAPIQVAYMPNIDGIAGCDPQDTVTKHSQGLAALANVTSHELSETITDPRGDGWLDKSGQENGDKCAWAFTPDNGGAVTLFDGTQWKLQGEWSNAAYGDGTSPTGYPNTAGQKGCIPYN
jgi:hypothetical protein